MLTTAITGVLMAACMGTPAVALEMRPTGIGHGAEFWAVPEFGTVDVVGIQASLEWRQDVLGIGAPVAEGFYGGFHPNHPWSQDLDDGDALWLWLAMPAEMIPAEGLLIATIQWPDATDPFELRLVTGLQHPSWTFGTLVAGTGIPTPQLWDGVESSVYLPEPTTLVMLLGGGVAALRRRR